MSELDHTKDLCDQCGAELKMPENPREKPRHECGVLDALVGDYDWEEVFKYADGEWIGSGPPTNEKPNHPFTRADVAEIFGSANGENDVSDWIMFGRLKNGLYFFIEAGCDYTGWGCREGGRAYVSDNLNNLIAFGMSADVRERFKESLAAVNYQPPSPANVEISTTPLRVDK